VCETLIPYPQADFSELDPEEVALLALTIAIASKRGFRLVTAEKGTGVSAFATEEWSLFYWMVIAG